MLDITKTSMPLPIAAIILTGVIGVAVSIFGFINTSLVSPKDIEAIDIRTDQIVVAVKETESRLQAQRDRDRADQAVINAQLLHLSEIISADVKSILLRLPNGRTASTGREAAGENL